MVSVMPFNRIGIATVLLMTVTACTVALPPERPEVDVGSTQQAEQAMPAPAPAAALPADTMQAPAADGKTVTAEITPSQPPPSPAQPVETIEVTATALSGYWRLTASSSIDVEVGLLSGVRLAYSGQAHDRDICRIGNDDSRLRATCIAGFTPAAEGSVDDRQVTLRWWSGPANVIFRGLWDDADVIQGAFTGGLVGISVTGDIPAVMHKIPAPSTTSDERPSAALMQAVFADLRQGSLTDGRYEAMAAKRLQPAFSWAGARAPSHSLAYLGQIHIRWHRWQRETLQDVYAVQSPSDRSLCRIALSERNRVVDFACQSEPSATNGTQP